MRQYQQVTDRIIAMLESGVRPWAQDWSAPGGSGARCAPMGCRIAAPTS